MASHEIDVALQRISERRQLAKQRSNRLVLASLLPIFVYALGTLAEPRQYDPATGHVYWLVLFMRHAQSLAWVTGTHYWFYMVDAGVAISLLIAACVVWFRGL
jgi:hypothetical protein